jgi:hypothetical protein
MMPITLPLIGSQNDPLSAGRYQLTLLTAFSDTLKNAIDNIPVDFTIDGHRIHKNSVETRSSGSWGLPDAVIFDFTLLDNPIPALAIVAGIVVVLGLTAIAITSWSISKVVDNPAAVPAIYWVLALLSLTVFIYWRKSKR